MGPDELVEFLSRRRPALVGTVATIRLDGSPHVVPVWYRWERQAVQIWTVEGRVWMNNALRDPRVAFSVQEMEPPFAAVVMRGVAAMKIGDETDTVIREIARRYLPAEEVDSYLATWAHARTIVEIQPTSVSSWSRGY